MADEIDTTSCKTCWHWGPDEYDQPGYGYCGGIEVDGQSGAQKFGYAAIPVTAENFGCRAHTTRDPEQ